MTFSEKLKRLTDIARVSNITLARGLNVDPSLVSRWKSGGRLPTALEETAATLAGFFSTLELYSQDRALLLETLALPAQATSRELSDALRSYLLDAPTASKTAPKPVDAGLTLLLGLTNLLTRDSDTTPLGPINLWPRVLKGKPQNHETFHGHKGKRQAVINFFHAVLSSGKASDVFLLSPDSPRWIQEDPQFSLLWEKSLRALLRQGCTVFLTIARPETPEALLSFLASHRQMFESGRFFAKCLTPTASGQRPSAPESISTAPMAPGTSPFLPTVFAAHNQAALFSLFGDSESYAPVTLLYSNVDDVQFYENMARAILSQASPLAHASVAEPPAPLPAWENRQAPLLSIVPKPGPLWLPDSYFQALPVFAGNPNHPALLALHTRRVRLEEHLRAGLPWVELWPESLWAALARDEGLPVSLWELGLGETVLTGEDLRATLAHMRQWLRRYESLQLRLTNAFPAELCVTWKDSVGAQFLPPKSEGRLRFFLTDLPSLSALGHFLSIQQERALPKAEVLSRIDALLAT